MRFIFPILIIFFLNSCSKPEYTWTSVGDSITWQNGRDYKNGSSAIGYQDLFVKFQKKQVYIDNQGFSGLPLSGTENSIYSELKDYNFKESNLITIFVGTNDFKLNKPIYNRDSLNSFHFCLNKLISKIKFQNPKAKIYLFTPLQRDKDGFNINTKNSLGLYLKDYRKEILNSGRINNIPVIDLYYESGINLNNIKTYTLDGLHPNNKGYELINSTLVKYITL
jgi:lysophospholipase L1-like esterase